ncbi:unnamed protein product, partial [Ectocarpus sp. 12 AP-2014]
KFSKRWVGSLLLNRSLDNLLFTCCCRLAAFDNEQPLLCTHRLLACLPAAAWLSQPIAGHYLRVFPPRSCLVSERALQFYIPRNLLESPRINSNAHARSTPPCSW